VDAYNANPTSMQAALENFSLIQADRKMAILGQMGELGDESDKEHRQLVSYLEQAGYDEVWLVGDNFKDIPCDFRKFHDVEDVKAAIQTHCPEGYYILIKGSNSNKLFQLPELL
jgi:UDP-N-acetylmuramoyl-tripeptide--D-alanyl-D-alanine ligase